MIQIAVALDRQEGRRPEALVWLTRLATRRDLQGTYWHGYGLFRLALFTYNQTQDPIQSMPIYEEMLQLYPDHKLSELALLYYCLNAVQLKKTTTAEKAGRLFLAKYPKSKFRPFLEEKLSTLAHGTNNP